MKKTNLFLALLFLSCLHCLGPQKTLPEYSREVARVDDAVIEEELLRFKMRLEINKLPDGIFQDMNPTLLVQNPDFRELLQSTLNKMIDDQVVIAYGKKKGVAISLEELAEKLNERKKRVDTKTLDTLLLEHNIPYSRWKQIVENEIKVQYVLDQEFAKDLVISASEIRSYYTQNEGSFVVPEKVRVRHIVTDTLEKAHEVHERLLKGENFAKMAVNHSQSPDRTKGGDLGYFSRGNFPKEFDDTCFGLQKGEISPIVKSDYGYHIFKLLDRQPPGRTSLLEASSVIYQKLFEEKLNKKYGEWITHARTEVTINTNTETLKGFFL